MDRPHRLEEVTADWLTERLGARVVSVAFEEIGRFSNLVWRVRPEYDSSGGKGPQSLVAKLPRPERRDAYGQDLANEIRFYREVGAGLGIRAPGFYFGDPDPASALLLIEEVGDLQPVHFVRGADLEHAEIAMDALARLHGEHEREAATHGWIPAFSDSGQRGEWAERYERSWARKRAFFAERAPGFVALGDALVGRLEKTLAPLGCRETLLHGDAHFENLALTGAPDASAEVLFHDWAGVLRGHPSVDVATFCVMSFPVERRREAERQLVERHAAGIARRIEPLPDAWEDYRRGVLHWATRMVGFVNAEATEPVEKASREMIVGRCAAAAADLEVIQLIR